jgi:hypothetical protein
MLPKVSVTAYQRDLFAVYDRQIQRLNPENTFLLNCDSKLLYQILYKVL